MKWIWTMSGVLALAMAASATPAQATAISGCPVPPGAVKVVLPSGLPPALRDAMGNVALPGEPFNETDVYAKGHPSRRYIFVWNIGTRWIVAMEQGGKVLRAAISTYDLGKDNKTVVLIEKRITFSNSVCAAATKLVERRN